MTESNSETPGGWPEYLHITMNCAGEATFFNDSDGVRFEVFYGNFDNEDADGSFELAPGEGQTVSVDYEQLDFEITEFVPESDPQIFSGSISRPDDCDDLGSTGSESEGNESASNSKPSKAPAAGVITESTSPFAPVAIALAFGVVALGVRRSLVR